MLPSKITVYGAGSILAQNCAQYWRERGIHCVYVWKHDSLYSSPEPTEIVVNFAAGTKDTPRAVLESVESVVRLVEWYQFHYTKTRLYHIGSDLCSWDGWQGLGKDLQKAILAEVLHDREGYGKWKDLFIVNISNCLARAYPATEEYYSSRNLAGYFMGAILEGVPLQIPSAREDFSDLKPRRYTMVDTLAQTLMDHWQNLKGDGTNSRQVIEVPAAPPMTMLEMYRHFCDVAGVAPVVERRVPSTMRDRRQLENRETGVAIDPDWRIRLEELVKWYKTSNDKDFYRVLD